jgi:hypothetical protein
VLAVLILTTVPLFLLVMTGDRQKMLAELSLPGVALIVLWLLVVPYGILGLLLRLRQLRDPLPI